MGSDACSKQFHGHDGCRNRCVCRSRQHRHHSYGGKRRNQRFMEKLRKEVAGSCADKENRRDYPAAAAAAKRDRP